MKKSDDDVGTSTSHTKASQQAATPFSGPIPQPPLHESPAERAARVERLRSDFLAGRLDLRVHPESDGVDRLLHDVFSLGRTRRRRR